MKKKAVMPTELIKADNPNVPRIIPGPSDSFESLNGKTMTKVPTQPPGLNQIWCKNGMFQPPVLGPKLPDTEISNLAEFIHRHGLWRSIVVDEYKAVLAGHCHLQEYFEVGVEWIPVIQIEGLSLSEKASFNDAYNLNNGGQS